MASKDNGQWIDKASVLPIIDGDPPTILKLDKELISKIESLDLPAEDALVAYYLNMGLQEENVLVPLPIGAGFCTEEAVNTLDESRNLRLIQDHGKIFVDIENLPNPLPTQDLGSADSILTLRQKLINSFGDPDAQPYPDGFVNGRELLAESGLTYLEAESLIATLNAQESELDGEEAFSSDHDLTTGDYIIKIRPDLLRMDSVNEWGNLSIDLVGDTEKQDFAKIMKFMKSESRLPFSYRWTVMESGLIVELVPDPKFASTVSEFVATMSLHTCSLEDGQIIPIPEEKSRDKKKDISRTDKYFTSAAGKEWQETDRGTLAFRARSQMDGFNKSALFNTLPHFMRDLPEFADILASNPQLGVVDDHSIDDGKQYPVSQKAQEILENNMSDHLMGGKLIQELVKVCVLS